MSGWNSFVLPDASGRRALFELYLHEPITDEAMEQVCADTAGAAAAFIKEVARRATLRSLHQDETLSAAVVAATGELHQTATPLLRASLAAAAGDVAAPPLPPGGRSSVH